MSIQQEGEQSDKELEAATGGVGGNTVLGPGGLPPAYLRDPKLVEASKDKANGKISDEDFQKIRSTVMDDYFKN